MARRTAAPAQLNRVLGPIGVMMLSFSALSPVFSVYIGGNEVMRMAGSGAALAFIIGGLTSGTLAVLYAEIGAAFPGAGGIYPSLTALLGRFMTFPYIVLMLPIALGQVSFAALGMADYLRVLDPHVAYMPVALGSLALAALIAILNVRHGALVTGAFLAVEAVLIVVLVAIALLHPARGLDVLLAHPRMLAQGRMLPTPLATLGLATVSGIWACGGASWALYFAEEMHDVRKKIGRVIAWIGALGALTIAAPMVVMLMSAPDLPRVLAAETPFAEFLTERAGRGVADAAAIAVVAAVFNATVATIMAFGRYLYATARDGIWPSLVAAPLARLSPRFHTPVIASLVLTIGSAAMCFVGERAILILISGNVFDYLLISFGLILGRRRGQTGRDYRAPAHPVIPVFALAVVAFTVFTDLLDPKAGRPSILLLIGLFLGALAYYHWRLREASASWRIGGAETEPVVTASPAPAE
ncbi:MAG TPA: APC family permease [Caulobacteraceae bacterium]|jgi:amino acid transporter|nr:APC family permease [Caulobacteraceae bacterium]